MKNTKALQIMLTTINGEVIPFMNPDGVTATTIVEALAERNLHHPNGSTFIVGALRPFLTALVNMKLLTSYNIYTN